MYTDLHSVVKNITVAIEARCPEYIYHSWGLRDNCHILWWAWHHYKKKIVLQLLGIAESPVMTTTPI